MGISTATFSQEVNVLKIAQGRIGAFVPGRREAPRVVTLYSHDASTLANGLLERQPKKQLPRALRGSRLEIEVGL